jgi:cytochrome P450
MLVHDLDLPFIDTTQITDRDELRAALAEVREKSWLAKTPIGYAVTRHADVTALLRDKRWHSAVRLLNKLNGVPERTDRPQSVLGAEGEDHARLRRLVAPAFSPRAADRLRPFMRTVLTGLIDATESAGETSGARTCDFVDAICEPYPIPIICELLGAPKEDWRDFSRWATDLLKVFNGNWGQDGPAIEKARVELDAYVRALIAERRESPREDLLTDLIAAEEQGDRLSTDELEVMVEAIILGGTDTTRNQLACSVPLFTSYPEQWKMLAAKPELAIGAVEESMRYLGAIRGTGRYASEEIEWNGVTFPEWTVMVTSLVAANFDESVFADPQRFDITRPGVGQHLTFGSGMHFCMGYSLAKAELQEALPLLAQRWPDLALNGRIDWKPNGSGIWGPERLPISF